MKPKITSYIIHARHVLKDVYIGVFKADAIGNAINMARKKRPDLAVYTFYEPIKKPITGSTR